MIKASNPAILVKPDLSVYVFGRLKDSAQVNRGIAFTAPSYKGPYSVVQNGDNLLPENCELEDPTIWWANNQHNILLNDWKGKATGLGKGGAQYFSKDGMHYQFMTHAPPPNKTDARTEMRLETFNTGERMFDGDVYICPGTFACIGQDQRHRQMVEPQDDVRHERRRQNKNLRGQRPRRHL